MTSGESSGRISGSAFEERYARVGDVLTVHVLQKPAFSLTRRAVAAGIPVAAVTTVEALLSALAFWLFWKAHYWPGLALAAVVMLISVVGAMMSRLGPPRTRASLARAMLEGIAPLLWWWAWEHGLAAYGRPIEPVYATMVLWVVVGGTIAIDVIDGLTSIRFNMEIHAWRPLDTRFRLLSASRNTNLVILAAALLFRRPDSGLVLVAWWVLISLIFHAVRFAQLTELQARRQKIASWLDE